MDHQVLLEPLVPLVQVVIGATMDSQELRVYQEAPVVLVLVVNLVNLASREIKVRLDLADR